MVDHVVGVSRFTLEQHRSAGFFEGVAGTVVYNPAQWFPPKEPVPPPEPRYRRFAFLGRIEQSKGVEQLLTAVAMVSRQLAMYGEGNDSYWPRTGSASLTRGSGREVGYRPAMRRRKPGRDPGVARS